MSDTKKRGRGRPPKAAQLGEIFELFLIYRSFFIPGGGPEFGSQWPVRLPGRLLVQPGSLPHGAGQVPAPGHAGVRH